MIYKFLFPNKAINQKLNRYCNNFYNLLRIIQRPNSSPVVMNGQRERKFPRATPSSDSNSNPLPSHLQTANRENTISAGSRDDPFLPSGREKRGKIRARCYRDFSLFKICSIPALQREKEKEARKRSFLRRVSGQLVNK